MKGKVCLITGASSGIGRATTLELAKMGATVVMACRNKEKSELVQKQIQELSNNPNIDLLIVDLASQDSIREFVRDFKEKYQRLDILINNAGAYFTKRSVTKEGVEMTFAVNYLSRFLLTNLLLDVLEQSAPSRIINVAGAYHAKGEINFDDLQLEDGYNGSKANNQAKLADVLFTYELARRMEGTGVTVNCLHPGAIKTDILEKDTDFKGVAKIFYKMVKIFFKSPEKGAETPVFLATSPEVQQITGKYFVNKKMTKSAPKTYDDDLAKRLWEQSVELTDL